MGDYKSDEDTSCSTLCNMRRGSFHSHVLMFNNDPTGSIYETNGLLANIFPIVFPVHVETERTASYYVYQYGRGASLPHNELHVDAVAAGEVGTDNIEVVD